MSVKNVLVLLCMLSFFTNTAFAQLYMPPVTHTEPQITVNGEAELQVSPDQVVLTFGVETKNSELQVAKGENDGIAEKVIGVLKTSGIESKDIQTDFFRIHPQYEYHKPDRLKIYTVKKRVIVTLKEVDRFEDVLSACLTAGANVVHGIDFQTTELRKHRDKARSLAIQAAKEKAEALAAELQQTVGKPIRINEQQGSHRSWYSSWWSGRAASSMSQNVVQSIDSSSGTSLSGIAPGKIKVTASVAVAFELRPETSS